MSAAPVVDALRNPDNLRFPANFPLREDFERAGGRLVTRSTGHLVFYRPDGRRFLACDPAGNPLHECEWERDGQGQTRLVRARIRLDWGSWVGIKPAGLVNETTLNLATRPGWQRLAADDLRAMAAQALRVPLDEVRWFYRDEDLSINSTGRATIRHRKDAFYWLEAGDFSRTRFMSCMGAMHWQAIDFLPVVELFKSLLPGTGSAAFELIRGLYDDQNEGKPSPSPLRYRGIPTYPSEAAFHLFSSFFTPQLPSGRDILATFMDPSRSHEVLWFPSDAPPLRYFDREQGCCLTVQGGVVRKVTRENDQTGLPYQRPKAHGYPFCDRSVLVRAGKVFLQDRQEKTELSVPIPPGVREDDSRVGPISAIDWRSLFSTGVPPIPAESAFGAVLLYPEDEKEIDELSAQPFVADYLQDLGEQDREIGAIVTRADRVLIENGDAVISTCIPFDRPRQYQVRVTVPVFAQKQAQQLWGICANLQRWDWLAQIQFVPIKRWQHEAATDNSFDVAYLWVPYAMGEDRLLLLTVVKELHLELRAGAHGFVVGPGSLSGYWAMSGFRMLWQEPVDQLPTFRMHRTILPKARLKAGLTLYCVKKG